MARNESVIRLTGGQAAVDPSSWAAYLGEEEEAPPSGRVFVSLGRFLAERARWVERGEVGVVVAGEAALEELLPALGQVAAVAIRIPKFTDGRAYTLARLLRERAGYGGELRAVGDVLYDQLAYLGRCGFDVFELRSDKALSDRDVEAALRAFSEITVRYQPAADERLPLFKRRRAAQSA